MVTMVGICMIMHPLWTLHMGGWVVTMTGITTTTTGVSMVGICMIMGGTMNGMTTTGTTMVGICMIMGGTMTGITTTTTGTTMGGTMTTPTTITTTGGRNESDRSGTCHLRRTQTD